MTCVTWLVNAKTYTTQLKFVNISHHKLSVIPEHVKLLQRILSVLIWLMGTIYYSWILTCTKEIVSTLLLKSGIFSLWVVEIKPVHDRETHHTHRRQRTTLCTGPGSQPEAWLSLHQHTTLKETKHDDPAEFDPGCLCSVHVHIHVRSSALSF